MIAASTVITLGNQFEVHLKFKFSPVGTFGGLLLYVPCHWCIQTAAEIKERTKAQSSRLLMQQIDESLIKQRMNCAEFDALFVQLLI